MAQPSSGEIRRSLINKKTKLAIGLSLAEGKASCQLQDFTVTSSHADFEEPMCS